MEIERKFLVRTLPPGFKAKSGSKIRQGYFPLRGKGVEIRLRENSAQHFITIKGGVGRTRQVPRIKLKSSGWAAIEPGIKRSYRDGRRRYRQACQTGHAEDFHQWRKGVKDLLYQTGLL